MNLVIPKSKYIKNQMPDYSQTQSDIRLPSVPQHWIRIHSAATAASLATGAVVYTLTNISGNTATAVASNTVSIAGTIAAAGVRMIAGNIVGNVVQASVGAAANMVSTSGRSATQVGSLLASTAAAATVGAAFMIGSTLMDLFTRTVDPKNTGAAVESENLEPSCYVEELREENDFILRDYLLCDISSSAKPRDSYIAATASRQTCAEDQNPAGTSELSPSDSLSVAETPKTDQGPPQMPANTPLLSTSSE